MKKQAPLFCFLLFFLLLFHTGGAQVAWYNYTGEGNLELKHYWKFHDGDNSQWAASGFDDSKWDTLQTKMIIDDRPEEKFKGIGWFRIHFKIDSVVAAQKPIALVVSQNGASEIYLDGIKLISFGEIGISADNEIREDHADIPIALNLIPGKVHVIAVRYSNHQMNYGFSDNSLKEAGFTARLLPANEFIGSEIDSRETTFFIVMLLFGFFIALGIVHLLIFLFYRAYKSNLYYFFFIFSLSYFPLSIALEMHVYSVHANMFLQLFGIVDLPVFFTSFLAFLYSIFYEKFQKQLWVFMAIAGVAIAGIFVNIFIALLLIVLIVAGTSVEAIRVIIVANRKKKTGARIIGLGGLFLALFVISMILLIVIGGGLHLNGDSSTIFIGLLLLSIVCLPLCMSIHLAREFAITNRSLSRKLKEVEILSAKSIEQEKEKQKFLETEKDRLEEQVKERTSEISEQKKIIEEKNKELVDSIHYAKKLQEALLPTEKYIEFNLVRLKKEK